MAFAILANYCFFPWLGLYEDDYTVLSPNCGLGVWQCLERSWECFLAFPQGRPLSFIVPLWLGALGWKLGAPGAFFWFAAAIVGANTLLMYRLSLKIWNNAYFAILASLLLVLFPADKIRPCPHAVYVVQGALGVFLLSCQLLLSRRYALLSYVGVATGLLFYELFFFQIVFFPLLVPPERRSIGLKRHWGICGLLLMLCLALRSANGEERLQQVMSGELVGRFLFNLVHGPPTSLLTFVGCLRKGIPQLYVSPGLALVALLLLLALFRAHPARETAPRAIRYLATCVLLLYCGYAMALNTPADAVMGRETRAHSAAAFPWALALSYLWTRARARLPGTVWLPTTIVYLLALFGKNVAVQLSYAECWQKQQVLWSELLRIWPQPQPGSQDVILLQTGELAPTQEMQVAPWSLPFIPGQLVRAADRRPPITLAVRQPVEEARTLSELTGRLDFFWLDKPLHPRYFLARPRGNHFLLLTARLEGNAITGWDVVEPARLNWEKLPLYSKLIPADTAGLASPFKEGSR